MEADINPILAECMAVLGMATSGKVYCRMHKIYLPVPDEFSFELSMQFLQRSAKEILHRTGETEVTKLLKVEEQLILFRVSYTESKLFIEFLNGLPSPSVQLYIQQYVIEWFDLENDLKPFYRMASEDKLLKELIVQFHGYRIIGQPDLFESLIWAVLGQQINVQFAYTLKQRFVEQFGEKLEFDQHHHYLFPEAEKVSMLHTDQLMPLQFSKQKAVYTVGIAEAFAQGKVSKEKLRGLPLIEAKEELMKIKGIGNWTANFALMKTFRYPDAFPLEDVAIHNAIKNLKKMKAKPTLDQVKRVFKKYKGWEAYATLYLWKSL
jgi:DNA-3-methyladenine glycosylase II